MFESMETEGVLLYSELFLTELLQYRNHHHAY